MQLYAVNFIPLPGSLYMFRVLYTPIIRSTIFNCIYSHWYKPQHRLSYLLPAWPAGDVGSKKLRRYYGLYQWLQIQLKIVLLMMGVYNARNMQSEPSSGIKLPAYSCICWLFHRIQYCFFKILIFLFVEFRIEFYQIFRQ